MIGVARCSYVPRSSAAIGRFRGSFVRFSKKGLFLARVVSAAEKVIQTVV